MRQHHGLCLRRPSLLQLIRANIGRLKLDIHKDRNRAILDDGRNRGRKTGRNRNDLVTPSNLPRSQERRRERRECEQVRRRSRIDEQAEADTEIIGKPLLELPRKAAVGEPELKGGIDQRLHLIRVKDAPGIIDAA